MQNKLLKNLSELLVPVRHSRIVPVTLKLIEELLKQAENKDEAEYFEFFADILFLKNGLNDLVGLKRAFDGLGEIISAGCDAANLTWEFREHILECLPKFQKILQTIVDEQNLTKEFTSALIKSHNTITFFLGHTRQTFSLSPLMIETFKSSESFARDKLRKLLKEFTKGRKTFFTEPLAEVLKNLIIKYLNDPDNEQLRAEVLQLGQKFVTKAEEHWRKLCVVGYRSTRLAAETPASNQTEQKDRSSDSAWAISVLLSNISFDLIEDEDVIVNLNQGKVHEAISLCESREGYVLSSLSRIRNISIYLTRGESYPWNSRQHTPLLSSKTKLKNEEEPQLEVFEASETWEDEIGLQIEEGAPLEDLFDRTEPTKENSPLESSAGSKAFRAIHSQPSWGRTQMTAEIIGLIWNTLIQNFVKDKKNAQAVQLYVLFSLIVFFGFEPRNLLRAKFVETFDTPQTINRIEVSTHCISIYPARSEGNAAFAAPLDNNAHYLPSCRYFRLPLPPALFLMMNFFVHLLNLKSGDYLFGEPGKKFVEAESRKTFNKLLKPLGDQFKIRVTIERVAKAVRALLRENGELHELEIALISSEIPRHTASPMFYTNYNISDLTTRYLQAINTYIKKILLSSVNYSEKHDLLPLGKRKPLAHYLQQPQNTTVEINGIFEGSCEDKSNIRIGSPFVPRANKLRDYLAGLKKLIRNKTDFILDHNRETAYAALMLMVLNGLRPLEISFINERHLYLSKSRSNNLIGIRQDYSSLTVIAKLNQKHTEWRNIPLSIAATKILTDYKKVSDENRQQLLFKGFAYPLIIQERLGESLFFYLRRTRIMSKLTTRGLSDLLRMQTFLEYEEFPWKLNAPRHFYRTVASDLRVPEKVINALMGHQTAGSELIGQFSAADYSELPGYAEIISQKILELLDCE
jgi:integrase